jgi:hypothetical protein
MMFKDAVVLRKEEPDDFTVYRGMTALQSLLHKAIEIVVKE